MSGTTKTIKGRRREPSGSRLRLPLLAVLVVVIVFCLVVLPDLMKPDTAQALDLSPGFDAPDFMDPSQWAEDALKKAGTEATGAIQDSFFWMMNQIFGGVQAALSVELLVWLTKLPDFSKGQVGSMERSVQVAAGAFLGCVLTLSILRFWLGSYGNGGGVSAGLEGVFRTAFAALMIGLWPRLFDMGIKLSNAFSSAMLHDGVKQRLENLFQGLDMTSLGLPAAGAGAGAIGVAIGAGISLLMWIIIAFASVVLFLGLIVMKIMLTAGTVLVFVVMPLAFVLWPLPETSWIANALAKTTAVLLAIPVLWILVFGAASAIGADIFFLSNNGTNDNFLQTGLNILLVKPLVACALLYMAIVLPTRLLKMAPIIGNMGRPGQVMGAAKGIATYAGYRKVTSMVGSSAGGATKPAAAGAGGGAGAKTQQTPSMGESTGEGGLNSKQNRGKAENEKAQKAATMSSAAGMAAGAGAGGAAGAMAGQAGASKAAGAMSQSPAKQAAVGGGSPSAAPVSKFQEAPAMYVDSKGGPEAVKPNSDYANRVKNTQQQMNSMPDSQRPNAQAVQSAWTTLGASPSAQTAIGQASAAHGNQTGAPPELAKWSNDSENPYWGSEAQEATRTIGEASPSVRENVVTGGKGYGGGGGGSGNGGAKGNGNGGGNASTPRPKVADKPQPSSTAGFQKPPTRQVGTSK